MRAASSAVGRALGEHDGAHVLAQRAPGVRVGLWVADGRDHAEDPAALLESGRLAPRAPAAARARSGSSCFGSRRTQPPRVARRVRAGDRGVRGARGAGGRGRHPAPRRACRRASVSAPSRARSSSTAPARPGFVRAPLPGSAPSLVEEQEEQLLGEDELHRPQADRTRTGSPSLGPSVGVWRTCSRCPGTSSSRCSRRIRAAIALISSWPKRVPMRWREPPPNGT